MIANVGRDERRRVTRRRRNDADYGKGAGAEPTPRGHRRPRRPPLASADPQHRVPSLAFQPGAIADTPILPIDDVVTAYYLRLVVADRTGVLARITGILAAHDISIDAVLQRPGDGAADGTPRSDLIILTHDTVEGRMRAALAQMQALESVLTPIVRIRKEELN